VVLEGIHIIVCGRLSAQLVTIISGMIDSFTTVFINGEQSVKGKPWTVEEEKMLRQMVEAHKSVGVIAKSLGKTLESIRMKIRRLGLEEVDQPKSERSTSTSAIVLPKELPTIEETLQMFNAALEGLKKPGIEQSEVLRLRSIIQGVKIYQELFADYLHYREVEAELVELRRCYEELVKKAKDDESKAVHE
jgi:hypothetical protein